jgi:2-phospho-L-lactate/phosphoenolpyruvate guanylyltransferase
MIWALVPAKAFDRGKSRLAPALPDPIRQAFAQRLFEHVLETVIASHAVDGILISTDSPAVAEAARPYRASVRLDPPGVDSLAGVIDCGLVELAARGARAALVLMADLPAIQPADVRAVVALLADHQVVLVPAADGRHTNALALSPPTCLRTAFGRSDSFEAHLSQARAACLTVAILENPRLAFDVDGPEDHARLLGSLQT